MKNNYLLNNTKKGMTLTELMVSTMLVGIVMLGAISANYAILKSRREATDSASLAMQTSAIILNITRNASNAVGDANNPGMVMVTIGSDFCFRQDIPVTPGDYADDTWKCYTRISEKIYMCERTSAEGSGLCIATDHVLGTVFSFNPTITTNEATSEMLFSIEITCYVDPTAAYDLIRNPSFTLESEIVPAGHSI